MDLVRFHYGENNINTGPLKEIPEICIDHFHGDDLNSSVFFLSHAHTDHLVGLETEDFMRRLNQPGVRLYCHPLTPILLESFERYLGGPDGIRKLVAAKKIVPLDVGKTKLIRIPKLPVPLDVKVTLLSAGHCPGSVMFLFETSTLRVLHTGDFRLTLDDLKRMPHLHDSNGKPKPISHLYVDTTFCSKSANLFPNRKDVLQEAIEHIQRWISKSKQHVVSISFSAKFAHEYILLELYKVFRQKIHVTPERRQIYQHIPGLYDCVTLNSQTQLHLCGNIKNCVEDGPSMILRLSAIWYTKRNIGDRENIRKLGNNLNLCYSMHSSLEEIAQTIDYLKPKIVTPLVLPVKSQVSEIQEALKSKCESSFKFEDYRSGRDDFGGASIPEEPCAMEQDETNIGDDVKMSQSDEEDHANSEEYKSSPEYSYADAEPVTKRSKLGEEYKSAWQIKFSPSSKSSQSSSDGSQNPNSQEISSQGSDDMNRGKPLNSPLQPVKASVRRNLEATHFGGHPSSKSAIDFEDSDVIRSEALDIHYVNSNIDDDDTMNSQRL